MNNSIHVGLSEVTRKKPDGVNRQKIIAKISVTTTKTKLKTTSLPNRWPMNLIDDEILERLLALNLERSKYQ